MEQQHYSALRRIVATVSRLPPSVEKVQFSKLLSALDQAYRVHGAACVEARVRPGVKTQRIADQARADYLRLRADIELSLTLAALFAGTSNCDPT